MVPGPSELDLREPDPAILEIRTLCADRRQGRAALYAQVASRQRERGGAGRLLFSASIRDNLLYARPDASMRCSGSRSSRPICAISSKSVKRNRHCDRRARSEDFRRSASAARPCAGVPQDSRVAILDEATSAVHSGSENLIPRGDGTMEGRRTVFLIASTAQRQ